MKLFIKVFLVMFLGQLAVGCGVMWFNRIKVYDSEVCKNNHTLATEVNRRLQTGEMEWYQMLYCPEMEDRWGISLVGSSEK